MLFNVNKCKVMHMGYNNTCPEYFLNGTKLENVSEEKGLGVIMAALCNRGPLYFCPVVSFLLPSSSSSFFFLA